MQAVHHFFTRAITQTLILRKTALDHNHTPHNFFRRHNCSPRSTTKPQTLPATFGRPNMYPLFPRRSRIRVQINKKGKGGKQRQPNQHNHGHRKKKNSGDAKLAHPTNCATEDTIGSRAFGASQSTHEQRRVLASHGACGPVLLPFW